MRGVATEEYTRKMKNIEVDLLGVGTFELVNEKDYSPFLQSEPHNTIVPVGQVYVTDNSDGYLSGYCTIDEVHRVIEELIKVFDYKSKSPNSKRFELEQRKVKALEEISITQALDFICSATDLEQAEARRQMLKDAGVAE